MQFNSFVYILLFLPLTILVYFSSNKINSILGKIVIIISSVLFYAYTDWTVLEIIGISILFNYLAVLLLKKSRKWHKAMLLIPIVINIGILFYFKYTDFVIVNINAQFDKEFALRELVLPLGISFFTFQQIAYIVAIYRDEIQNISMVDYLAFILFFPKVLMGPLADPVDFINQLNDENKKKIDIENIAKGIKIFSFGLFKKMMIADVFARAVAWGYSNFDTATSSDWILIMLFYTFEIYFDFSGYSDMAVGSSKMLNIDLPINFDSPYKAISIRDFWKRWHISLTKFLTKYIYIPLGGSKKGTILTYINIMVVFFVSGIWHGANWTFILWGIIHGLLMIVDRIFEKIEEKVFEPVRWFLSFMAVNVLWLLFRSDSIEQWQNIIKTILHFDNTIVSDELIDIFTLPESQFLQDVIHLDYFTHNIKGFWMLLYVIFSFFVCLIPENNYRNINKLTIGYMLLAVVAFVWGFICLGSESVFIYCNF